MTVRIICQRKGDRWLARAFRTVASENPAEAARVDPFGIECEGATEEEATATLNAWLDWQREHAAALEALQQAERAYHRTIAGSAFVTPADGVSATELQKDALNVVEAARVKLDAIRARKPGTPG